MERVITEKANWLVAAGYEVCVVTSHQKGRPFFFSMDRRVEHRDLNVNTHIPFLLPLFRRRLERILFALKADIFISTCSRELAFLPSLEDGSRKIAEYHFSHDGLIAQGKEKQMKRMEEIVGGADVFVALTRVDMLKWQPFCRRAEQIYNPCTFDTVASAPLDSKVCISAGRFEKQKNYEAMIKAWKIVVDRYPDWKLELYGSGSLKDEAKALSDELGLSGSIVFNDATKDIRTRLMDASCYLMTSVYEGFPMVLLESAACGLPAVSFDCPCGPAEMIDNGVTGYVVKNGDIAAFADAVCTLAGDENLRRDMGRNAAERAGLFSKDAVMARWTSLFDELVR